MTQRLDQERESNLEPKRYESTFNQLSHMGYRLEKVDLSRFDILLDGNKIQFFPYSGWFTGKGIGSGRGFKNLLKKLEGVK